MEKIAINIVVAAIPCVILMGLGIILNKIFQEAIWWIFGAILVVGLWMVFDGYHQGGGENEMFGIGIGLLMVLFITPYFAFLRAIDKVEYDAFSKKEEPHIMRRRQLKVGAWWIWFPLVLIHWLILFVSRPKKYQEQLQAVANPSRRKRKKKTQNMVDDEDWMFGNDDYWGPGDDSARMDIASFDSMMAGMDDD